MGRGYIAKLKEIIGWGGRQERQGEGVNLLKKYQKPAMMSPKQIYGETWRQLNKNFKDSGYDAKITKDGDLRIGKNSYHVIRDLQKNTPDAVREIVGYFMKNKGVGIKDRKQVQNLYEQFSSGIGKAEPTLKSDRPVMYGRKHKNQLNVNLEKYNAKYTDKGDLKIGKDIYRVKKDLEANTADALKEITYYIAKHENLKKKDMDKIRGIYRQLSTDMLTPRRVGLEGITTSAIIALSIASLYILSSNITGNVVAEASTQSGKLGLTFCLLGIIALAAFKGYRKTKFLN